MAIIDRHPTLAFLDGRYVNVTGDDITGSLTIAGSLIVDTTTLVANAVGYENKVGINTATPGTALEVLSTTDQLTLRYDGDTAASFFTDDQGRIIAKPTRAAQQQFRIQGANPMIQVGDGTTNINSFGFTSGENHLQCIPGANVSWWFFEDATNGENTQTVRVYGYPLNLSQQYGELKLGKIDTTVTFRITSSSGHIDFNDDNLYTTGHIYSRLDDSRHYFGTANDMSLSYTGTVGRIDTSLVAASDLQVDCGTDKTIVLDETVWEDLQFQISNAKVTPNNLLPTWEAFTTNTSEYAFSVNDEVDTQANELPHWWKQGTTGHAHLHITTKAVPAQEEKAQFTVTFAYADTNEVWAEAPLTAELTIPISTTALTNFKLDLGDLTLTNYLIGAQIRCRVKRVAKSAGGTEYVGDIFITQVGIHLEADTIGSRQEITK